MAVTVTLLSSSGGNTNTTYQISGIGASTFQVSKSNLQQDLINFIVYAIGTTVTNPMTSPGDMIAGGTAGAPVRVAANTANITKFLTERGTGSIGATPIWFDLFGTENFFTIVQEFQGTTSGGAGATSLQVSANIDLLAGTCSYQEQNGNSLQGLAVLNGITAVVIPTTGFISPGTSRVHLTIQVPGGTPGSPYVFSTVNGTSFSIKSTSATDTSTVAWTIFQGFTGG